MSNYQNDFYTNSQTMPYQGNTWQEQQDFREKRSGCGCWLWGCGCGCLTLIIAMIAAGVGTYYVCWKGVPLKVSPETTVITGPLKGNGNVDFFTVIEKEHLPPAAPEDNGFKEVLAAYGKAMFSNPAGKREWQYEETCRKLGLNPGDEPTAVWTDYSQYYLGEAGNVAKLASSPWKIDDQPKMKEWLDKVNGGLDILQNAVMKEHYFLPMVRRNENELALLSVSSDALNFHRKLAESLRVRAMQRLGANQNAEAWKDITAALRLERSVFIFFDFSDFEDKMEAIAAKPQPDINPEELASQFGSNFSALSAGRNTLLDTLANSTDWKKEDLDGAIADLEALPPWIDRQTFLKIMQYAVLDMISSMNDAVAFVESLDIPTHHAGKKGDVVPLVNWGMLAKQLNIQFADYAKSIKPEDMQTVVLKTDKEVLDELNRKMTESMKDFSRNPAAIMMVNSRSVLAGDILGDALTAAELVIFKQMLNSEQERQLLRTAFAVKRFQLENKELPKTLEDLKLEPLTPELPLIFEVKPDGISLTCGSRSILLKK
ncbi:MAG: hypothetical protein FWE67_08950 [Planctomycetaceae bacterium]|nr:hypothetical protein [Planctomycetaceae bacterium]